MPLRLVWFSGIACRDPWKLLARHLDGVKIHEYALGLVAFLAGHANLEGMRSVLQSLKGMRCLPHNVRRILIDLLLFGAVDQHSCNPSIPGFGEHVVD